MPKVSFLLDAFTFAICIDLVVSGVKIIFAVELQSQSREIGGDTCCKLDFYSV